MANRKYAIGVDFGTASGRAVLVDVSNGKELSTAIYKYSHSVIDEALPVEGKPVRLEPDWALQDPDDYIRTFKRTIPAVLRESGVSPENIIGLGIDFTACTMLPTLADGTPLCVLPEYRRNPHS
jgi:L-ribulokinase